MLNLKETVLITNRKIRFNLKETAYINITLRRSDGDVAAALTLPSTEMSMSSLNASNGLVELLNFTLNTNSAVGPPLSGLRQGTTSFGCKEIGEMILANLFLLIPLCVSLVVLILY